MLSFLLISSNEYFWDDGKAGVRKWLQFRVSGWVGLGGQPGGQVSPSGAVKHRSRAFFFISF